MATTIIIIGFSIYTLILIGTLIWYTQHIKEAEQNKRKLKKNGILTQAKIIETWHPKKDKSTDDILDDGMVSKNDKETELIVKYEHEIKNEQLETEKIRGTLEIILNFRNVETEKNLYTIGSMIDVFYLPKEPRIAMLAKNVRSISGDYSITIINIIALASSIFVLFMAFTVDLPEDLNNAEFSTGLLLSFLMYVVLMAGAVLVSFGAIFNIKEYIKYRRLQKKGNKEKGEVLNTWIIDGSKGSSTFYVKYTYPAIAPYSLENTVNRDLYYQINRDNSLEVYYLEEDKFTSNIVNNTSVVSTFWLFILFAPVMTIFILVLFYQLFLEPFLSSI